MKNSDFTKLLQRTARAMTKAQELQRTAEAEYERRYGVNPSDADDDHWIDSLSGAGGDCNDKITWRDVDKAAVEYAGLEPYRENNPRPS